MPWLLWRIFVWRRNHSQSSSLRDFAFSATHRIDFKWLAAVNWDNLPFHISALNVNLFTIKRLLIAHVQIFLFFNCLVWSLTLIWTGLLWWEWQWLKALGQTCFNILHIAWKPFFCPYFFGNFTLIFDVQFALHPLAESNQSKWVVYNHYTHD